MSRKTKIIGAGVAVASILAVGAFAFAQGGPGHGHGRMGMGQGMGHGMMQGMGPGGMGRGGDGTLLTDPAARLDAIKGELGIKPDQSAAWDAYAKVVRDFATERREHHDKIDRDAVRRMEPKEHQAFRDTMQKQREEGITRVRTAAETLLGKLDDAQKEKARRTLPGLASAGPGGGSRQGMMGGHGGQGHGGQGDGMGHGMGPRW